MAPRRGEERRRRSIPTGITLGRERRMGFDSVLVLFQLDKTARRTSKDLVHMGTSYLIFLNKLKIIFLCFKKTKKIFTCGQLFIAPMWKKSCANTLYFGLHKNEKRLNLSMYILNLQILLDFVIFM
jgi:hypothetical protein